MTQHPFNIGVHYIPCLVNGDPPVDPSDEFHLESFMEEIDPLIEDANHWHWDVSTDSEIICKCEVSGLYSNCYEVTLNVYHK